MALLSGCIVIPVGDLLKSPPLAERVLVEGAGLVSKEKIAVLELQGFIGTDGGGLLWSRENSVAEVRSRLKRMRQDAQVKAVVLRISSIGGEVTASDMIYNDLMRFKKETGVAVVASIVDQGASGAYYVAMAADRILAQPTAIVGSIGVMMQSYDLSGLLDKVGVAVAPIKSTERKDLGSPFRRMSSEEREVLQRLVDDMYERFVEVVESGRPELDAERVRSLADGRVVSGMEAKRLGLVDDTGYLTEAIETAREMAQLSSPTVIHYSRSTVAAAHLQAAFAAAAAPGSSTESPQDFELYFRSRSLRSPGLYYLWRPGP